MTAHSDGNGSSWNENLDVDQPHGLDYQEFNDIRIGTRLRMSSGHTDFADNTVGGIHKPGGAGVLGMEITSDATGDITSGVISDGTYQGRGMIWAYDGSQDARLWCSTADSESTAATDFTLMLLNPDKQWDGGDVTWLGEHAFNEPVEFSSVDISGSLDCTGALACGSTVGIENKLTCASAISVDASGDFSDAGFVGDVTINGSIKIDGTATEFGESLGIGLFYDPTVYAAAENLTFPNGLIMKTGVETIATNGTADVSFAVAFAAKPIILVTDDAPTHAGFAGHAASQASTGFTIWANQPGDYNWLAIGF